MGGSNEMDSLREGGGSPSSNLVFHQTKGDFRPRNLHRILAHPPFFIVLRMLAFLTYSCRPDKV